jgi:Undecaprenyl-phosphate glucose phosphotransferase
MLHDISFSFAPAQQTHRDDAPSAAIKFEGLSHFLVRAAAAEFLVVAITACATSLAYGFAARRSWSDLDSYFASAVSIALLILGVSLACRHYATVQTQPLHRFLWNGGAAVGVAFSFFLATLFLLKVTDDYSRATFFMQWVAVAIAVLGMRAMLYAKVQSSVATGRIEARRAVLIGDAAPPAAIGRRLKRAGVHIVKTLPFPRLIGDGGRGPARELVDTCRALKPDDIVILAPAAELPAIGRIAEYLSQLPVSLHAIPSDVGEMLGATTLGELGELATIQLLQPPLSVFDCCLKRAFDIFAAALGLALLSPLLALVAIAIKLDSRGPVLFRQMRHGYNDEPIRVFKFRSMASRPDASFQQATKNDPRVTRVGRLLRRTNLDELPQLINVLRGDMSIVGPRPHPIALNVAFSQHISPLSRRHNVKPGITGWAQVNGHRGETDTLDKMRRRFEHDIYYIDNWTFTLDVKIIVMTLFSKSAYMNAF